MNLKHILCSFFIVVLCYSCEDNETNNCSSENPLEDIVWLKELKTTFEVNHSSVSKSKITQYTYKGKTVFMIENCIGCADSMASVYDCEKNEICVFGGIAGFNTCPDFDKEATNKKILWEN